MLVKNNFLKNIATIVACFAVCAVMCCGGCKKSGDDEKGGSGGFKVSPPAWIQGKWGMEGYEIYKFTTDDILVYGFSFKSMYVQVPGVTYTCRETKTEVLYEIHITVKAKGTSETGSGTFSFKKGDGTYIEAAQADDDDRISPSDYERFDKLN